MLLEGKVKYRKLPSGNSEYMEFYDKNGEMCMIYNQAWGNAKRGIPMASEESVNVEDMQSSFDAKAQQEIEPMYAYHQYAAGGQGRL